MRSEEARDAGLLAGRTAAGIARAAHRTQDAVTETAYSLAERAVGPVITTPVRSFQRGLTRGIYAAVGVGLVGAGALAGRVAASRVASRAPESGAVESGAVGSGDENEAADLAIVESGVQHSLGEASGGPDPTYRERLVRSALNGFVGDRLVADRSSLALTMTLRAGGRDVTPSPQRLAEAYGVGARRLVVFVHGLVENETSWTYRGGRFHADPRMSLPVRLWREHGFFPVYVWYNTGEPVAANGAALDRLLQGIAAGWPGPIDELALVGHSMGGLVIDSALMSRNPSMTESPVAAGETPWTSALTRIVTLGAPIEGAPLERWVEAIARAAGTVPPALWLQDVLGVRSRGITDLRHPAPPSTRGEGPRHLAVFGTFVPWQAPVTDRWGDGLVPVPRAVGAGLARGVPSGETPVSRVVLPGVTHQGLLNHPRVHNVVTSWWDANAVC
ncbi:MAG: hypothetical protein ABI746_08190 [Dermatophilaceae bacterium]